jgi:hypothetical protein
VGGVGIVVAADGEKFGELQLRNKGKDSSAKRNAPDSA